MDTNKTETKTTGRLNKLTSACVMTDTLLIIINTIEAITSYQNGSMLFCLLHLAFAIILIYVTYAIRNN